MSIQDFIDLNRLAKLFKEQMLTNIARTLDDVILLTDNILKDTEQ